MEQSQGVVVTFSNSMLFLYWVKQWFSKYGKDKLRYQAIVRLIEVLGSYS